jgi:predicted O-methyltransferase YrrM
VAKAGSDLNDVLFRILPLLKEGVLIHFHDIYWPFEYAEEDVMRGRSWNEAYLLRAFLANNERYQIELFPSFLEAQRSSEWTAAFPGMKQGRSSSLWLRKTPLKA